MQQICELPPTTIIPCESHVLVSIGDFILGKANRVLFAAIVQKKGAALEEATPVQIGVAADSMKTCDALWQRHPNLGSKHRSLTVPAKVSCSCTADIKFRQVASSGQELEDRHDPFDHDGVGEVDKERGNQR